MRLCSCALRFLRWHLASRLKYNVFWWQMHNKNIKLNKSVVLLLLLLPCTCDAAWPYFALPPLSSSLRLSAKSKRCPHLHLHFFRLTPQPHLIFLARCLFLSLSLGDAQPAQFGASLSVCICVCVRVCWLIYGVDNNPAPASCDYEICNLCFVFCICFVVLAKEINNTTGGGVKERKI